MVEPREFSQVINEELFSLAKRFGKLTLRGAPVPVILTPPTTPPATIGDKAGVAERGDNVLRVSGDPGELLLWVSGRDVAQVELTGSVDAFEGFEIKM